MKWDRQITVVLAVLCATFFVSTVLLYLNNEARERSISFGASSTGWVAYQARLDFIHVRSMLKQCTSGEGCDRQAIANGLVQLAGRIQRLGALGAWDGMPIMSARFPGLADFASSIARYVSLLNRESPIDNDRLQAVAVDLMPVGDLLQAILSEAVLASSSDEHNGFRDAASLTFVLLSLCSAGLAIFLGLQLRQRNALLQEIGTLRTAERESQAGTVNLLESLPVPVLVTTPGGTVAYANQAAHSLARLQREREDVAALGDIIRQAFGAISGPTSCDFPLLCSDGSLRHLSVAASSIRLLGNDVDVFVVTDSTSLRDAELRALAAGKLAVLGELSSAITHELNQPLSVIRVAAANGRTQADIVGDGKAVQKFQRIEEQIDRAARIIDNVRILGRPSSSADVRFSVSRSVGSALSLVSQKYRLSSIDLQMHVDIDERVTTYGNPTLFEISILNILLNACEAFDHAEAGSQKPTVWLGVKRQDETVQIVISDNAGGIPDTILPRIFDSFVSSKDATTGMGLGLSIARRAIDSMRGWIGAENGPRGAIFTIKLPVVMDATQTGGAGTCLHQLS